MNKESNQKSGKKYICENPSCGKEHDGSYGSGRFCSLHCRKSYIAKKVKNRKCGFAFYVKNHKSFPYGAWKCEQCGFIAQSKHKLQKHIHDNHARCDENGNPIIWNKDLTLKDHKSLRKANKTIKNGYATGRLKPWNKNKKCSQEYKRKIRISTINYLLNTKHAKPRYNKKSIAFLDALSKEKGWNLQHAENGGEFYTGIGYWVDAYDKERNIVVEYDESRHYDDIENNVLIEKDIQRQNEIIEHLHCEFYRYNEKMNILWKVN